MKDYKKIKKLFVDDPETLRSLEQQEQAELLREIAGKDVKAFESIKGQKGDTPVKGVDYFTLEELAEIKEEVTPQKGVHYFTSEDIQQIKEGLKEELTPIKGIDYVDGKDADENRIIREITRIVPTAEEIMSGITLPKPIDEDKLIARAIKAIPKAETLTVEDIVAEIKKKKLLELKDIKGARLDMNDQRWHGGGLSVVAHDTTLTGDGTQTNPLHATGGGHIIENNGTPLTARANLNFIGATVADNAGNNSTDVTITGGALLLDQTTPQTIINGTPIIPSIDGSSVANGDLTLQGTSHTTRTTSYVLLNPNGGNVGIGTTAPNDKLTVGGIGELVQIGNGAASDSTYESYNGRSYFGYDGVNQGLVVQGTAGKAIRFYTNNNTFANGTAQMVIDTSGNVGIGTTGPTAKLHLPASTATANTASLKIDAGVVATSPVTGNIESDGTHIYWTSSTPTRYQLDQQSVGGSGITRSVNSISSPATAGATAATDYVYFVSGTTTLTLPTAVGNLNRYSIKNVGVNTVTISTTASQTIDGSVGITLPVQYTSVDLISDGANWNVL